MAGYIDAGRHVRRWTSKRESDVIRGMFIPIFEGELRDPRFINLAQAFRHHAWGFEGDLPELFEPKSNLFEMEWPPRSGKRRMFPEVDQACFFSEAVARRKIKPTQVPFLDRLRGAIKN